MFISANVSDSSLCKTIGDLLGKAFPIMEVCAVQTDGYLLEHHWQHVPIRKKARENRDQIVFEEIRKLTETYSDRPVRIVFTGRLLVKNYLRFIHN